YSSVSSTPGKVPDGRGDRICACSRALGHALCAQRFESSVSGRLQQLASGQLDCSRFVVSRPRNHLASANGTPKVIENSSLEPVPVCVEHQYVPVGVSV